MKIKKLVVYTWVVLLVILYVSPLMWLFSSSLKSDSTYTKDQFTIRALLPTEFRLNNYLYVLEKGNLGRAVLNTLYVTSLNILGCGFLNSLAAFALAYLRFPGKKFLMTLVIAMIIIPGDSLLLQNFITIKNLGLVNSYAALVIPGLGNAFFIYLFRQFFLNIPKDIFDSARMDGASLWQIYLKIAVPISKPVFIATSIFIFNGMWNAFLWPLIVITNPKYQVIQVSVQRFLGSRTLDVGYVMAALSISAIPPLIVFLLLQRYFVEGLRGMGR
ncbi:MAG: fructooligosaccharide transport system permease protein [Thermotogota bacterium]|nr:fructooligosaccharide transport system permease protein [Thermotogota bacterium]